MSSNTDVVAEGKTKDTSSYDRKDFVSDQTIRWCPGCGDYSILAQVQRMMPQVCEELEIAKENVVFVSGIGCSSRFPYYMDTYGFHTIHGRAPTFATGLRVSRPDLQVWVVTGDGDGLSIGGNHLIHALRRNIDLKIILFNNRIYGLTKGQYSPTSEKGKKTKSSPHGSLEEPINPLSIAIASEATFVGRAVATDSLHIRDMIMRVAHHKGSAFLEVFQNCNVFNDNAFDPFTAKAVKDDKTIYLKHGEPMVFGKENDKAISLRRAASGELEPEVVNVADVSSEEILVHDESAGSTALAFLLSRLDYPEFPVPLGVFRSVKKPVYSDLLNEQILEATKAQGKGDFFKHLNSGDTWTVS